MHGGGGQNLPHLRHLALAGPGPRLFRLNRPECQSKRAAATLPQALLGSSCAPQRNSPWARQNQWSDWCKYLHVSLSSASGWWQLSPNAVCDNAVSCKGWSVACSFSCWPSVSHLYCSMHPMTTMALFSSTIKEGVCYKRRKSGSVCNSL